MANYIGTEMNRSITGTVGGNENLTLAKIREKQNKNRKKKKLSYNSREISSQILRSVKSEIASVVLVRAKMKVGVLKRCLGTGEYNDREVAAAVAHAQRMVTCAKMKVKHLREEEEQGKQNKKEQAENKQQKKSEIKRRVSQKEREIESKIAQEKIEQVRKEKMQHQDLIRKKKMHRNKELSKIQEADMKYLKDKTEGSEDSSQTDYSGVSLELSMAAMGMQELQMSAHAAELMEKQLEQEIEMQVEMQMQMEGMASVDGFAADVGTVPDAVGEGAVGGGSFDISV